MASYRRGESEVEKKNKKIAVAFITPLEMFLLISLIFAPYLETLQRDTKTPKGIYILQASPLRLVVLLDV